VPVSVLSRRSFLRKACAWIGKLFGTVLFSSFTFWKGPATAGQERETTTPLNDLPLKQWCLEKQHHLNGGFLNPFSPIERKNLWRLLQWKLASKNHFRSSYPEETVRPVDINWDSVKTHPGCAVTYITHACVMIKDGDCSFLVDPVLSGLFGFKNYSPLTGQSVRMPDPDHILITHGHYDHLDTRSLKRFKKDTHVISPPGYGNIFRSMDMNRHTQLDWFEAWDDGKRKIVCLPCNHWTMRNPLTGPNDALWGSYLIKGASGVTVFVSGDLAWFDHFPEIGETGGIDLAIFNLGAYEPRWMMKDSHINPAETVRAFLELKARYLMVVHWGTFRLGDDPVHFPPRDIHREMAKHGLAERLINLNHGQTLLFDRSRVSIL